MTLHDNYRSARRWRKVERSPQSFVDRALPSMAPSPRTRQRRRLALGLLLILSFLVAVRLAAPLWVGIVFGLLMAFTMQPLQSRLQSRLGDRVRAAALITTLGTAAGCLLLGSIVAYVVTRDLSGAAVSLQQRLANESIGGLLGERGLRLIERLGTNEAALTQRIQSELGRAMEIVTAAATLLLGAATGAILALLIGSITMYYALVDWASISLRLERVLPLDPRHTRALVLEFREVGRSALLGLIATAAIQAVLATIGYAVLGLPHPVSFGILTGVASFVPVLATATVWVPVAIYFLAQGAVASGVILAVWGLLFITGLGEYVVRPRLVGGPSKGQPLLMLVGALGGVSLFGLPGIVVGPVLMSLFLAILRIYERESDPIERISTLPPIGSGPPASSSRANLPTAESQLPSTTTGDALASARAIAAASASKR